MEASVESRYMTTGEVGFCPACGTLTDVVVLPEDRLQAQVSRAMLREPVETGLDLGMAVEQVYRAGRGLSNDLLAAASERDTCLSRAGLEQLRGRMAALQAWLCLAAELTGELLDEPVDLMRLAAEWVKHDE